MGESLEDVFSRLSVSEEERMDILGSMGPLLNNSPEINMGTRVQSLDLNVMFMILASASSEEELALTCQTLNQLLQFLKPSFILEKYANAIESGLSKEAHVQVKILVLKTLQRMDHDVLLLSSHRSILSLSASLIMDPDLAVAKEVIKFLVMVSNEKIDVIFSDSIYPILMCVIEDNAKSNGINQLRVYELFVKIGSISQELLNRIVETQILNRLLKMAYTDDILVKLNVLELLSDLACTSQGYQFIVKDSGISSKLDDLLDLNNALSDMVLPGILKFFGNLAYIEPKLIFLNHPKFVNFLTEGTRIADGNNPIYRASIETLGIIAKAQGGLDAIDEQFNVAEILGPLVRDMKKGTTDVRVIAMDIFADFVNSDTSKQMDWFLLLGEGSEEPAGSVLLQFLKLPFQDVQSSAYGILLNISHSNWGSRVIADCPGFMEFLLNRDTARTKEIKEKKYEAIKNILNTGDSNSLVSKFGTPSVIKMKEYARDGPFYVRTEANVAYEEA